MDTDTIKTAIEAALGRRNASREALAERVARVCSELPIGVTLDCGIAIELHEVECAQYGSPAWRHVSGAGAVETRTITLRGAHVHHVPGSAWRCNNRQEEVEGPNLPQVRYADLRAVLLELPASVARWIEAQDEESVANEAALATK